MKKYHKIQSVYLRDPETKHKSFLLGQWTTPEFEYLANLKWVGTEKVDGTNIRVHWDGAKVRFGGRTDDAQTPMFLIERLQELFTEEKFQAKFPGATDVMLCGEGYGRKIQKVGSLYLPDSVDFILFDVAYDGAWFDRVNVEDVAMAMGVGVVPVVFTGTLYEAIEMVKQGFKSPLGDLQSEGLVLRPHVELMDRRGHRVITKVKTKDFN